MPLPLLLAALAATGASAGANAIGARKDAAARSDALTAQRLRQKPLDAEANAVNDKARDRYDDFEGQAEEKASGLEKLYAQGADEMAAMPVLPGSDSGVTNTDSAKKVGAAREETDDLAAARARMLSFGGTMGDIGREGARDSQQLSQIFGFQRGNEAPLAAELDAAAQAGNGWRTAGDIAGAAGAIMTPMALGAGGGAGLAGLFGGAGAPAAGTGMLASQQGVGGTMSRLPGAAARKALPTGGGPLPGLMGLY